MKSAVGLAAALALLLVVAFLPLPLHPYLDFQVMYHADMGLLRGIPVYDHAGQVHMIAQLANVPPEQVFVVPFPYPPWYALVTVWLALLPIDVAARVWFGLNLIMLCLCLWALTDGLPRVRRLGLALPAVVFPPVLGSLFVGQYAFPVLLGAVLLSRALQRKSALLVAVSAALLTFKPHLGGLILLITAVYLWSRREDLGRRALPGLLITGAGLFALGFVASPAWPAAYVRSLTGFESLPGVPQCYQCAGLSVVLGNILGGGFGPAVVAAAALLVLLTAWLATKWGRLNERPEWLVAAGALVTLLVSPYLLNYDYVLLLLPFAVLGAEARGLDWAWVGLAYALPFVALSLYGTAGNISLVAAALILFIHFPRRLVRPSAAGSEGR
jgi:hypothetical protein